MTKAHKCLVATSSSRLDEFSKHLEETGAVIRTKYEGVQEREEMWRGKWGGLVVDLEGRVREVK